MKTLTGSVSCLQKGWNSDETHNSDTGNEHAKSM